VEYEWWRMAGMLALAAGLWLVSRPLPEATIWGVLVKGGLWLLWPLLVWVLGLPSAEEKEYVRAGVRQGLAWLRPGVRPSEAPALLVDARAAGSRGWGRRPLKVITVEPD
jgi:hypothetical protein